MQKTSKTNLILIISGFIGLFVLFYACNLVVSAIKSEPKETKETVVKKVEIVETPYEIVCSEDGKPTFKMTVLSHRLYIKESLIYKDILVVSADGYHPSQAITGKDIKDIRHTRIFEYKDECGLVSSMEVSESFRVFRASDVNFQQN